VYNERGEFACLARVSDDVRPGVLVAPMGWWNADWPGARAAQATTSQELTELGNAPIFNDNRVELEPAR
jgi:anaerobic selenocysteine-containing dehydrogenase